MTMNDIFSSQSVTIFQNLKEVQLSQFDLTLVAAVQLDDFNLQLSNNVLLSIKLVQIKWYVLLKYWYKTRSIDIDIVQELYGLHGKVTPTHANERYTSTISVDKLEHIIKNYLFRFVSVYGFNLCISNFMAKCKYKLAHKKIIRFSS